MLFRTGAGYLFCFLMLGRTHMVGTAHRSAVPGSIRTFDLFFVLFIVFFAAFFSPGHLFKSTCCGFSGLSNVPACRTIAAKFIPLGGIFIHAFFAAKAAALTVEVLTLALTLITVAAKTTALTVEVLTLALITVTAKAAALTVEVLALALITVTAKATALTVEVLTLALTAVAVRSAGLSVEVLALTLITVAAKAAALTVKVLALALITVTGPDVHWKGVRLLYDSGKDLFLRSDWVVR